jgi:hypothetical protein
MWYSNNTSLDILPLFSNRGCHYLPFYIPASCLLLHLWLTSQSQLNLLQILKLQLTIEYNLGPQDNVFDSRVLSHSSGGLLRLTPSHID